MKQVFIATVILLITIPAALLAVKGVTSSWDDDKPEVRHVEQRTSTSDVAIAQPIQEQSGDSRDLPFREEIKQSYKLNPGAEVEVRSISGSIDIETLDSPNAEIHIIRSAKKQETLQSRKTVIEHEPERLLIGNDRKQHQGFWDVLKEELTDHGDLRTRVMLKLPRNIKLEVIGVSGAVNVGELDDRATFRGMNGRVRIAQVTGGASFNSVNGRVECTVKDVREDGLEFRNINGPVEMRFIGDVNADVEVRGLNGPFNAQLPNVVMGDKRNRSHFEAKIGNGGTPVEIRNVNGPINFLPVEATAKAASAGGSKGAPGK